MLQPLLRRAPANLQVLEELAYVYFELAEWPSDIDLAERMRERMPARADIYLSLAGAEIQATYLFQAMRQLRAFLVRFPHHLQHTAMAEELQELQKTANELVAQTLRRHVGDGGFEYVMVSG